MLGAFRKIYFILMLFVAVFSYTTSFSQEEPRPKKHKHERTGSLYFSWGYNTEWYTRSDVHVKQSSLGNDYTMVQVKAEDHRGWDKQLLRQQLTIPQYNYRIGYYFNKKQDLALEINFDHTKYIISDGQSIRVKGKMNNANIDTSIVFSEPNGFFYYLNNGANFFLLNLVKRVGIYHTKDRSVAVDFTGKAGVGPVVPHVQNSLFGKPNNPGFQIGGWNTGLETALRVTVMRYGFLEFSQKVDYARYSNLKVYNGRANQNFGTYELILSAGVIFPTTHHNPLFTKEKEAE